MPSAGGSASAPSISPPNNISGAGGAIFNGGNLAVESSTFLTNSATVTTTGGGGAIANYVGSSLSVGRGTFTDNQAQQDGGAIFSDFFTLAAVSGSDFRHNVAISDTGGAVANLGVFTVTNSTFTANKGGPAFGNLQGGGGAIFSNNGSIIVHNVLIAFNVGGNCQLSMTLDAHDIDYPGTSCSSSGLHANPLALAPANNGGPTLTSALLPGSPAINAGDDAGCPGVDQRGAARPVGAHCDIGAFEFGGKVPWLWLPIIQK